MIEPIDGNDGEQIRAKADGSHFGKILADLKRLNDVINDKGARGEDRTEALEETSKFCLDAIKQNNQYLADHADEIAAAQKENERLKTLPHDELPAHIRANKDKFVFNDDDVKNSL